MPANPTRAWRPAVTRASDSLPAAPRGAGVSSSSTTKLVPSASHAPSSGAPYGNWRDFRALGEVTGSAARQPRGLASATLPPGCNWCTSLNTAWPSQQRRKTPCMAVFLDCLSRLGQTHKPQTVPSGATTLWRHPAERVLGQGAAADRGAASSGVNSPEDAPKELWLKV